jgi:acyl-CoA synthetase (AMP-forming)/AMP-acid ligase II
MQYSLAEIFDAVAQAVLDREALITENERITYNELLCHSKRLARFFIKNSLGNVIERKNLKPWQSGQDHIALYLYNTKEYVEGMFGAYFARCAPYNVNYRYVEAELEYLFGDTSPKAVIYDAVFEQLLESVRDKAKTLKLFIRTGQSSTNSPAINYNEIINDSSLDEIDLPKPSFEDLYILCTGGTTGLPKATLWHQYDIYYAALGGIEGLNLEMISQAAKNSSPVKVLVAPPLMHGAAQWVTLRTLFTGGTVILYKGDKGLVASDLLKLIEIEKPLILLIVGDAFARPLADEIERGDYDLSSLKIIVTGGAITSETQKNRLLKLIPGLSIVDVGGASETGSQLISVSNSGQTNTVFEPEPTTLIVDESQQRILDKSDFSLGWLVKVGHVPLGYLNDENKTKATFKEIEGKKMAIPGDRARYLPDGKIELLGRDSVTINSGGEKIFAEEVEAAIGRHPAIADVVVTGRPSEKWGSEVVAIVKIKQGMQASDEDLIKCAAEVLARYKLPKEIIRVSTIVRSPAGKADYRWAKEIAKTKG